MFPSLAARETYVAEINSAARKHENIFVTGQKHFSFQDNNFAVETCFPSLATMKAINQMERTFPGKLFEYPGFRFTSGGRPLFRK